jgi:hypothetical protein
VLAASGSDAWGSSLIITPTCYCSVWLCGGRDAGQKPLRLHTHSTEEGGGRWEGEKEHACSFMEGAYTYLP